MAVYTIADLHLSLSEPSKSMRVFGNRWDSYEERLEKNWRALVSEQDTVVIPGDISWAKSLTDARADFAFLDSLPGQKIIGKGNHDFWWATAKKVHEFWKEQGFSSLHILYNNAYLVNDMILCGTRGWFFDEKTQGKSSMQTANADFEKLCNREAIRLKASLDAGMAIRKECGKDYPLMAFLHFPPIWNEEKAENLLELLNEYQVKKCYFGHIHGYYKTPLIRQYQGIRLEFIASDHIHFCPRLVTSESELP